MARAFGAALRRRFGGFLALHAPQPAQPRTVAPERHFEAADGQRIPVFADYRYSVKPGWRYFKELQLLDRLQGLGRLAAEDVELLRRAQGTRTLGVPPAELRERVARILPGLADLLIAPPAPDRPALLRPSEREIEAGIAANVSAHRALLASLRSLAGLRLPERARVLEIGFSSGGHSLFAFERLGYRVLGIDNDFSGLQRHPGLAEHIRDRVRSGVSLLGGDITGKTDVPDESLDLVYSASVMEHVLDLDGAAREAWRMLRPGGLQLHLYHSFFSPTGGHALGTLDAPWAHVRLGLADTLRYLEELRPLEAEEAKAWATRGLNRARPGDVERSLLAAGFRIRLVQRLPAAPALLAGLTPEVAEACLRANPGLSLEDLVAETVLLAAERR